MMSFRKVARLVSATWMILAACSGQIACDDGSGVADALAIDYLPRSVDFGSVVIGQQKTLSVTLRHSGESGVVVLGAISMEGLSGEFTTGQLSKTELAVGETATFDVIYRPTDASTDSGVIVVAHNVATQNYKTRISVTSAGQTATLITEPSPIDFGEINIGNSTTMDVSIRNVGTASFKIEQVMMSAEGSGAFKLISIVPPEGDILPVDLDPDEVIGVTIEYTPQEGANEYSQLVVKGEENVWSFDVFGTGLGPRLFINPKQIEIGGVDIGSTGRGLVVLKNVGNDSLRVTNVALSPGSHEGLAVEGDSSFNLEPEDERDVYVAWTVTKAERATGQAIGWLQVASTDPASPAMVSIYGFVKSPLMTVTPDNLDMGYGAQGITVFKSVAIRNDGSANLVIDGIPNLIEKTDEKYGQEWSVSTPDKVPSGGKYTLAPGEGLEVKIGFTNKGPETGDIRAKLRIVSNDKSVPNTETLIPVKISRGGTANCIPQLVPSAYDFGLVPMGFKKELPIRVVNTGLGYCSYKQTYIQDCSSGFGIGFGGACAEPFTTSKSTKFVVSQQPGVIQNGIGPGGSATIFVRFQPPQTGTMFGELTEYNAIMGVMIYDSQLKKDLIVPKPSGTGTYSANLKGTSGVANLAVLPSEVKFGLVTLGCASKTYQICAYNTGSAPLQVTGVKLDGCTPEFKLKGMPPLPRPITTGSPLCFGVNFVPQDTTEDSCILKVLSNEQSIPELFVGLSGQGTIYSDQTDVFTQLSGQEVDILFVIDDSGSMGDDQQTLIENFEYFINQAEVWQNDYHIGVVSTGLSYEHILGKLNLGNPRTLPRYITPGPNAKSQFANLANLGSDGDNSEGALANAQAGLSAPLVTDTGVSCTRDEDCSSDPNLCTDAASCPFKCLESTCGGWNKGFLREDAQLEIIALSDEEDQSSGDLGFYIDFFRSIKGFYNQNMMHFNAIVGVDDGTLVFQDGTKQPGCIGPTGSGAYEAKRYIEVANATNGKVGSICDPNYKEVLTEIGSVAFGLKQQFFLSRIADPNSITVKVKGVQLADNDGWEYDAASNSIIFDVESPNMPQEGDEIEVHYETLCFEP
ncbi:MAG TPA: choice-of-anchor D domain-containing protein [Myxococcota bacterium]|nr:choice-of-anchor D domain-containing protein [Myxococcota bacterium]HOH77421.1 choice-of-anchor D domain-containing protein [Myxococcota bacterium]